MDAGCPGVVNGTRLEQACHKVIAGNQELVEGPLQASLASKVTNHIMAHFAMLRNVLHEEQASANDGRRYPKSGGFRRSATAPQWASWCPLMDKLRGEESGGGSLVLRRGDSSGGESLVSVEVELDADGWPTISKHCPGPNATTR